MDLYFHKTEPIRSGHIASHFFYMPIILSALWWGKRGIIFAIIISLAFVFIHNVFPNCPHKDYDFIRISMFILIGIITSILKKRIEQKEEQIEQNIKERKQLQKELIQSERLAEVGHLAAGIAHEFNNILAIISGNTDALLSDQINGYLNIPEEDIKILTDIKSQIKRGSNIVNNMTAFAKPKKPEKEVTDISFIIDDALKFQRRFLEFENINILKEYTHRRKNFVDIGQLQQVFLNLINNSRHAIKPKGKGTINISIKETEGDIEIYFSDNGIGMDEETKANIFKPFFTTKGATAKVDLGIKGTGLGLSVAETIVKINNGTIKVESKESEGTTFIITFPAIDAEQEKEKSEKEKSKIKDLEEIKILNIMIIDDEKNFTDILFRRFDRKGYKNVDIFNSGKDALLKFKEKNYDIVLLDLVLPGMNGEEIFEEIKKINPYIPIIIISGKVGLEEDNFRGKGAYAFFQKPFDFEDLFEILNQISNQNKENNSS